MSTSTTYGARDHARAQEIPVDTPRLPEGGVWAEYVGPDAYTHKVVARGTAIRLANLESGACAHVLLYNADQPWERLNVADTVKVQWNAYLSPRNLLLSDQGRVLASVLESDGEHDALCGTSAKGRALFTLAAAKNGLTPRDLPPSLSFFQSVRVLPDGKLDHRGPSGTTVVLRAEMPLIVLIANTAHPLDDDCKRLAVTAWRDTPTNPEDPLWTATPEGRRAFENTVEYLTARGQA
ncbi:DUF1989 domain-containing protein [Actinocrispum wychmicini]|uniref:DUF1989 domain-containing protein n=1 Tax=Actinocrispum wychmicini TaxID=1213861 RepID=A0A4R2J7Z2_9PSEU|nr:DUF1989 domain-containing protein [Actinocrispum wychmicini]TCO53782.1 hypothetical protein EV192_110374 [Actinocrispum wychmicini]